MLKKEFQEWWGLPWPAPFWKALLPFWITHPFESVAKAMASLFRKTRESGWDRELCPHNPRWPHSQQACWGLGTHVTSGYKVLLSDEQKHGSSSLGQEAAGSAVRGEVKGLGS